MADPRETKRISEPTEEQKGLQGSPMEEIPGHTPGMAEGEDDDAPHRDHPFPDPDKTPGSAEG